MAERYTNMAVLMDRLMRHPLLQDTSEETVMNYVIEFFGITGVPENFINKVVELEVEDYRSPLPCDFESIIQVKPHKGLSMVESGDSYFLDENKRNNPDHGRAYIYGSTYRIQGDYIHFSYEKGSATLSYRAIATDDNGYPLIPEDQNFLMALEWYVKTRVFTILVDLGRLPAQSLQNAQQQYCWYVGKYQSSGKMKSLGQAEKLLNSFNTLIIRAHEFKNGFRNSGRETLKIH